MNGWLSGWIKSIGEGEGRSLTIYKKLENSKHRGTAVNLLICLLVLCSMVHSNMVCTLLTHKLKIITTYIYQPSHAIDIFYLLNDMPVLLIVLK